MSAKDLLGRGLEILGLPPSGALAESLSRYMAEIERLNPSLSLVGASGDELVVKHVLDSLAPLAIIKELLKIGDASTEARRPRIADLGSGAGLPGVPLALALPESEIVLMDRMTRRIRFLESLRDVLPLSNVDIVETQIEHARGSFDLIVFRAFRPFERKLFKRVFALCDTGGAVLAYKGKADKARAELAQIEGLYSSADIIPVEVPFLEDERCVVVLRLIA
jgi:16S rRNA (guanine527-N7)-methyltransferase